MLSTILGKWHVQKIFAADSKNEFVGCLVYTHQKLNARENTYKLALTIVDLRSNKKHYTRAKSPNR
jgi:hypothetical protein